jgi:hypothetical protein
VLGDKWQNCRATLCDIGPTTQGCLVELLDIEIFDIELKALKVDAAIDNRIEHKGVVRTGRNV